MSEFPDILDTKQACKYLSIGINSLYQLVAQGKLKPYRVGKKMLFSKRKLEEMVSNAD